MKRIIVIGSLVVACAGIWLVLRPAKPATNPPISFDLLALIQSRPDAKPAVPLPQAELEQSFSATSGEAHTVAMEVIMEWTKHQQVLTEADRNTLLAYLSQEKPESLESGEWEERVNEMLNFLRSQPGGVPGLTDLILHMAAKDPNPVLRMYALQHLAMWVPSEPVEENRVAMVAFLKRLAETPGDPLAGSALLFLSDLDRSKNLPSGMVTSEVIEQSALRLAGDSAAKPDVRISALHTCVDQGYASALPEARRIAADETLIIPLRKAAIHTIGQFGTAEDAKLLQTLSMSSTTLEAATAPALKRLQK